MPPVQGLERGNVAVLVSQHQGRIRWRRSHSPRISDARAGGKRRRRIKDLSHYRSHQSAAMRALVSQIWGRMM